MTFLLLFILMLFFTLPALALVEPGEELSDPALEARAREIARVIRCPVCESQNIENSNADVAKDLRLLIRERLAAGDTDEEVIDYLRARYGDSITLEPPLSKRTVPLWLGPFAVLAFGAGAALYVIRRSARA